MLLPGNAILGFNVLTGAIIALLIRSGSFRSRESLLFRDIEDLAAVRPKPPS
jgi:hypothetical protein